MKKKFHLVEVFFKRTD